MEESVRNFPPLLQIEAKTKISSIVLNLESQTISQNELPPMQPPPIQNYNTSTFHAPGWPSTSGGYQQQGYHHQGYQQQAYQEQWYHEPQHLTLTEITPLPSSEQANGDAKNPSSGKRI